MTVASTESTITPVPVLTTQAEPAATFIEAAHPRLATADPLDGETLERHLVAQGNHHLQGLAQRVAAARSRLGDLVAATSALSEAEDSRYFHGNDPEAWLLAELEAVHMQIAEAEAGRKRMDARRVARSDRITPLKVAVSERHRLLVRERDVLRERLYLLEKGSGIDLSPTQLLRQAGLTAEQIAAVGTINPGEADIAKYTRRLADIGPEILAIEAWFASGYRDKQHLAGLGFFDSLIAAAEPVDEVAP